MSPSAARRFRLLVPAAIGLALALAIRYLMVEPTTWGFACQPAPWSGGCIVRTLLMKSFMQGQWGWVALMVGIVAVVARSPWIASAATAIGIAALVLYGYEPAAAGTLLGLLVIARRGKAATARTSIAAA
jgi:hypothetical protein